MIAASLVALALAGSAIAAPAKVKGSGLAGRLARRGVLTRQSKPNNRVGGGAANEQFSSNWAGAVFDNSPNGTYTTVSASFTIPTPSLPSGGDTSATYAASAWVGIDGDTYGGAILQTGVDFTFSNGVPSYTAWYEWYPDYAYDFENIGFTAGDSVSVAVQATSTTSGTAGITNDSTHQSVTKDLTSTAELAEQNAEWIVEDFEEDGSLVPLVNFGTVTFSQNWPDPTGADIIDIKQNNVQLTQTTIDGSDVTVKYIGN